MFNLVCYNIYSQKLVATTLLLKNLVLLRRAKQSTLEIRTFFLFFYPGSRLVLSQHRRLRAVNLETASQDAQMLILYIYNLLQNV